MKPNKVAVIIGSIRKESWSRKIAKAIMALAPASLALEFVEIDQLPLYNQDFDENPPNTWITFRQRIKDFDAILFVAPEYNRSIPGVLKNAIDVGSRPYGQSVWSGKPTAVISISVGVLAGFGANQHLRQTFVFLDMPCMQQPEAYIGNVASLFDESGNLVNAQTKEFLFKYITAFNRWIEIHCHQ